MNRKIFLQQLTALAALPLIQNCNPENKSSDTETKTGDAEIKSDDYVRLLRHATLLIKIDGVNFLVDPMLAEKDEIAAYKNTANNFRNPMVPLPFSSRREMDIMIENIDAVLLTHTHNDHWDRAAKGDLPPGTKIICQPSDVNNLNKGGFKNTIPVETQTVFKNITIYRTGAQHGRGEILKQMGMVSGYVLQGKTKKIYIVGDSVWCNDVKNALDKYKPDVTVVNAGGAQFLTGGPVTMMPEDVINTANALPSTKLIAVHMDAVNHCLVKRTDLKAALEKNNLAAKVLIPADGEKILL